MSSDGEKSMEVARSSDKVFAKFRRDFCCYGLGIFLIFSSFSTMMTLQSSVNIEAGLGVASIACAYVTAVVSGFSLTPMLIRRFGAKKCILMGTMFHITYDLANFYPRYYTLIPTAILIGIAESTIWTCISIFNAHFGAEYHKIKNHPTKTVEFFVSRLSGYYFVIHHLHHDGVCNGIVANTLKQVGRQLLIPKQLLIIPITLYTGLLVGYIFSDLPRSFVSCVSGFSKIGIYSCLYGVGHVISPAILGKRGKHLGRIVIFSTSTVLDICNLLFCLLWTPSLDTAWIVYISYVTFGLSDGIWQSTLIVMYTEYFPGRQHVVGATYISIFCLGIAINCAWNTTLCVYMKIYILLSLLAVGFTLFCIAERLHRRELENEQKR
ncbi:protein unc-93 homolog A-like isoform X2 [Styela clava]